MIQTGFISVLQLLPDTSTSASLLVSVLFVKSMVGARTVELALDVILRVVEVLSERFYSLSRRLEYWSRIRSPEEGVLQEVDDGIWIGLLLKHYTPVKMSRFPGQVLSLLE